MSDTQNNPNAPGPPDLPGRSGGADAGSSPDEERPATPTRKRSRWRWVRRLLLLLLLLAILAPRLATIGPGRRWFERRLSLETHLKLKIGSIATWWWSPIKVRQVEVSTQTGKPVGALTELRTSKSLFALATAGVEKGDLFLTAPQATLNVGDGTLEELESAIRKIDPTKGLLRRILDPENDVQLRLVLADGTVSVRPPDMDWQKIIKDGKPRVRIQRQSGAVTVGMEPGEICHLDVSPVLCDLGLKYVLPVLAGAIDADGHCQLHLEHCQLDLTDLKASELEGVLLVESISADVNGPLVRQVTALVSDLAQQPDVALSIRLTDNCPVSFAMTEEVVTHEGLKFGIPTVLPSLVLQTSGDVALDQAIDLRLSAAIPFEEMGEAEVLQRMGSPELAIPIVGTLNDPKLNVGEGQVVKRLVGDLVRSLTDDQIDPAPLLEQIGSLGLLERRRQRKAAEAAQQAGEPDLAPFEEPKGRLLQRLRDRGGLLRRRNRQQD